MAKGIPSRGHLLATDPASNPTSDSHSQFAQCSPEPPAAIEACVHDLISKSCDENPEAPAVCAWDGDFTYKQLGTLARLLGEALAANGVGPEVFVPIYFEKSRWTVVAILGVLHAGGAFVLLDPSHPIQRLEWICQTVKGRLIIASSKYAAEANSLASDVLVLDEQASIKYTGMGKTKAPSHAAPHNAAYAVFTSGTTGKPKGIVIEHRSASTSCVAYGLAVSINRASRVLQFSAYGFDVSLLEMLTALILGGCICIPSEAERQSDLAAAARRLRVTWATLTPSVARTLDPTALPTLKTLVCGGEAMSKVDMNQWIPHVELINAYGPAECTMVACITGSRRPDDVPTNIGRAVGGSCWVVNEHDIEVVCRVGQIGELLIEGPIVGRGYIGVKSNTAVAFIDRPGWLAALWPHATGKVYKTGDLARCHEDGSIECLGRKDAQLKLHGQRMEAAEIEYHLRQRLPARDVAVEVVQPRDDLDSPLLAAFVVLELGEADAARAGNLEPHLTEHNNDLESLAEEVKAQLRQAVPGYMVPAAFLALSSMPLTTNGKLDRRSLRRIGGSRTRQELQQANNTEGTVKISPRNTAEEALQQIWAEVLRIPSHTIGINDSFWNLGGSSIRAMKLAGLVRRHGFDLELHDIWVPGTLEDMAASLRICDALPQTVVCVNKSQREDLMQTLRQYKMDRPQIQDIYPCTRLQEGLFSLTAKRFGAYTLAVEFTLPVDVDITQFRRAWDTTIEANPILRTRIIADKTTRLWQAVIQDRIPWDTKSPGDDILREWKDWKLGQRLVRLALNRPTSSDTHVFTLVIHHAIVDGWGLELILEQVDAAYNGQMLEDRPFRPFLEYVISQDQGEVDQHWRQRLAGLDAATFPKLPSPDYVPIPRVSTACSISISPTPGVDQTTVPNQLQLAWGLLISYYTNNWDVLFGLTVAGRGVPVHDIETMTGPTIASIPVRLLLDPQATVADSLKHIQTVSVESMPFEQIGLQNIGRLGAEYAAASHFQSHLVIQPDRSEYGRPPLFTSRRDLTEQADVSSYGISIIAEPSTTSLELVVTFDPMVVEETQMERMIRQLDHIFQQVRKAPEGKLGDIQGCGPSDLAELQIWNSESWPSTEQCAHELIYQRTIAQPDAPAVCAWDGEFTYHELDQYAGHLAKHLVALGVGPEIFVPLYFEKSRWTSVAMLGVLKAGGAFALLDPSHPNDRLQQMCREMHGSIVVCSEANAVGASQLGPSEVVIVGSNETEWMKHKSQALPSTTPQNAVYAVFTSGSTGKPKGAVMTHGSWCAAAQAYCAKLRLGQDSRVLQFSAYAFDVSVTDSLLPLVAGACVCIPSENDRRSNLAGAIASLRANWAMITPSVARILSPQAAPTLDTLVLVGDPMNASDIEQWSPCLHLMNGYGPAECAVLVSLQPDVQDSAHSTNLGTAQGACSWIVDPQDSRRLSPIGAVGELLVEGPIIARGYLNEAQKTAEAFVESPPWLHAFRDAPCRLYKTGDLVHYTSEGTLRYIGRKDTQVKIRGQRVEIGEVEYHLGHCFPNAHAVAVDVITPPDGRAALLAGFVCYTRIENKTSLFKESDGNFRNAANIALSQLNGILPPYMIPAVLIPMNDLPISTTGKLDRRRLRAETALLSNDQLDGFIIAEGGGPIREPETSTQSDLQRLFADVLSLPRHNVGIEDHFFRRGGDSLSAMKLVALARQIEYHLTVGDVFTSPKIVDLAEKVRLDNGTFPGIVPPFSLGPRPQVKQKVLTALLDQTELGTDQVEDLYPCTPMQEGLMALSLKDPGKYVARFVYNLAEGTDMDIFREAFDKTIAANPILRTRFTQGTSESFQVVIEEMPQWETYGSQQEYEAHSRDPVMGPNLCLLQPTLIASPPRFVLAIHHALYDGQSLHALWDQVEAAYRGQQLEPRPFSPFIHYLTQEKGSDAFWRAQFEDLNAAIFPALPSPAYIPTPYEKVHRRICLESGIETDFTLTTAIQLAWAVLLSYYTDSNDVVYGLVLSGRNAPVPGIERFTGPTMTTVPFRLLLNPDHSIEKQAGHIQEQLAAMITHEQTGLRNIRSISDNAARACEFQTQLIVQPPATSKSGGIATEVTDTEPDYSSFASYGLVLSCTLASEEQQHLEVTAQYDPDLLQGQQAQRMVAQMEHILHQILASSHTHIRDISALSDSDWQELARWNEVLPPSRERCLHELVLERCASQLDAPAICSWDGDVTYREVDSLSRQIAHFLRNQGLQEGSVVPLCLERSKWCILTMLAVLRAGATLVCIDCEFPVERVQHIVDQVKPQVIIASKGTRDKFAGYSGTILLAPFDIKASASTSLSVTVEPHVPAFILFTSGSTGRPKGIVMEHRHISTRIRDHSGPLKVSRASRVLHFASYAFDAYLFDIFTTLVNGGCVCIPSEADRINALEQFIAAKQVNLALFTPSILAMLDPSLVPSMQTIISAGEAIPRHVANRWASRVELINAYGPAETCVTCAAGQVSDDECTWTPGLVGPMHGGCAWVTVPSHPEQLAPLGAVGELIVESPAITRGYLNNPVLTGAAFIDAPAWLNRWRNGRPGRLYRTGDLVKLTADGSIRFVGRKDTQVKLRGQRIELEEVEYHVHRCAGGSTVVVDVAAAQASSVLFACIAQDEAEGTDDAQGIFCPPTQSFQEAVHLVESKLRDAIPGYMIPSLFLPLAKPPQTATGKVDRRRLREAIEALSSSDIQGYAAVVGRNQRQPSNWLEATIQNTWAQILNKVPDAVGLDDSFFHLGGDSISAMRVVSELKSVGVRTTVGDIFQERTIANLAPKVESNKPSESIEDTGYTPFSLSPIPYSDLDEFLASTLPQMVSKADIEDIYPCSPVQQGMLLSQYRTGDVYNNRFFLTADSTPDSVTAVVDKLAAAWHRVVARHPMLRSCVLSSSSSGGTDFQLVHRRISADTVTTILPPFHDPLLALKRRPPTVIPTGRPPHHLTLCFSPQGQIRVMLEISHVLMDGTSFQILLRDLIRAYDGRLPSGAGPSYSAYIAHLQSLDMKATQAYWTDYLRGTPGCLLPASKVLSPSSSDTPCIRSVEFDLESHADLLQRCADRGFTLATIIHVAWGLVLRAYTGSDEVCFGYLHSGRDVEQVPGIFDAVGPFIHVLLCRMHLARDRVLSSLARQVQQDFLHSGYHQHVALADIYRAAGLPHTSLFNTMVSFDKSESVADATQDGSLLLKPTGGDGATEYDLAVSVTVEEHRVHISLEYWSTFQSSEQAAMVADTFEKAIYQLAAMDPHQTVGQLDPLGSVGRRQICDWNRHLPPHLDACAHQLISYRTVDQPDETAVCSHDGDFTYRELDTLASKLAGHLACNYDIGPNTFVPICFEKSRWAVVAVLATLKTGAAFVLMDPAHPRQRLRDVCQQVQAPLVITSVHQKARVEGLASRVVVIGEHDTHWCGPDRIQSPNCRSVRPESPAYAVFTSGSTGKPKGAVISHASICTSGVAILSKAGLQSSSRVLHFSSYAFDASIHELLFTLLAGGCICIIADEERVANLAGAINRLQVNWACLTPSVARILDPSGVPGLQTLYLVGEAVTPRDVAKWRHFVDLRTGYGPAECSVITTVHSSGHDEHDAANIGYAYGAVCWITDADDVDRLAPVGSVGELIIEGTIVSHGYLNDEKKTRDVFISPPAWLYQLRGHEAIGRIYRTGDLVQYEPTDGSIRYICRKDTQVKLRGQRVEIGEVEYQLRSCFPGTDIDAVAEVIEHAGENKSSVLVAFIADRRLVSGSDSLVGEPDESFRQTIHAATTHLDQVLPSFMVPSLFIPLRHIPLSSSGKVDRRAIREAATALPDAFLDACAATVVDAPKQPPAIAAERVFQRLFASLFGREDITTIGSTDHFFRLGGDSTTAMALIPKAREAGYAITMPDVFTHPRLCDLARAARMIEDHVQSPVMPFALLSNPGDVVSVAAEGCGVAPAKIQDIYPCTPLQEGLMALSIKSPSRYVVTFRYELDPAVDLERFQSAWTATAQANPILRTRLVQSDHHPGTLEVVLEDSPPVQRFADAEKCEIYTKAQKRGLGDSLVQFGLVDPGNAAAVQFHLTLHHALYDGWTIQSLWDQVHARYRDPSHRLPLRPFNRFISHAQQQTGEECVEHWRAEFSGLQAQVWPAMPSTRRAAVPHLSLNRTISGFDGVNGSEYTTTTLIQLAWALVMCCYTDSDDLVFGVTLDGRSASVLGIEEITGPTITTFPLRVCLGLDHDTVEDAMSTIQRQAAERMPFQQFGLQNIRHVSDEAGQACQFQCHLGIQPWSSDAALPGFVTPMHSGHDNLAEFAEYALLVICHLDPADSSAITVELNYDELAVSSATADRILGQFTHLLQQLPRNLQTPLNQLDLVSDEDQRQLLEWNRSVPPSSDTCLHDVVLAHADTTPDAPAVSAWDGELTYAELDEASLEVATHLRALGVRPGSLVPLCFEKSKWAVITILAVVRAGGACVLIDPGHPAQHIDTIISRANAKLVLTSATTRPLIRARDDVRIATIPMQGAAAQTTDISWQRPSCHDTAFVIFTSGSTGQPKGILMEHSHICTSIRDHSQPMRISWSSRALHFASYAFDASIYELFSILGNGGCVCIPSDRDRLSNLAGFIQAARINFAIFTPSILNRLLRPEEVPTLQCVNLGGEAVTQDVVDTWASHVTLINGYGPAEATICAAGRIDPATWTPGTIGPVTGGVGWVTIPSDVSRLAPVGAVGELLIEGPVVTRGYLNDADRTSAAYIPPPAWLTRLRGSGNEGRIYRSGDLVQYTDDGGIRFVGRKDTQIKLRGQRVELAHVEHHVRLCFADAAQVIAEIVVRDGVPTLMAFIADQGTHGKRGTNEALLAIPRPEFSAQVHSATVRLKAMLPPYMVPMVFLQLRWVPRTHSDKLDRRQLRDHVAALSVDQMRALSMHSRGTFSASHRPRTSQEDLLRELWAEVLPTSLDQIGVHDDFFQLGGDSIQAMKLTSLLRKQGLALHASDVFAAPTLAEQALRVKSFADQEGVEPYRPGSLLGIDDVKSFAISQLKALPALSRCASCSYFRPSDVEDIFPVTAFQHQFLEAHQANYMQLTLPGEIDLGRLTQACQGVLRRHAILRSAFLPYENSYLQVMLRELDVELRVIRCDGDIEPFIDRLCTEDAANNIHWGTPYFKAMLVSRPSQQSVLVVRITHAQYDGQSFPLILQDLASAYAGEAPKTALSPPFSLYLRYRKSQENDDIYRFWREYLHNAHMTPLNLPAPTTVSAASDSSGLVCPTRTMAMPELPSGITISSLVKAAWAVVLAQVTGHDDLVFGHVLNGRDVPLEGAHILSGPCVTVSPIRITIPPSKSVPDLLQHVQDQYTRAMPYTNIDFSRIRHHATPWPAGVSFGSLITHQNGGDVPPSCRFQGQDCDFKFRIVGGMPHSQFHLVTMPHRHEGRDMLRVRIAVTAGQTTPAALDDLLDRMCSAIADLGRGSFPLAD